MDWARWSGTAPPPAASWSQLLTRARDFELQIDRSRPSVANWLEAQALTAGRSQSELTALAAQSYPLIHEDGLRLCRDFLNFKREHGHRTERTVYQGMDELDLVERLLSKVITQVHKTRLGLISSRLSVRISQLRCSDRSRS